MSGRMSEWIAKQRQLKANAARNRARRDDPGVKVSIAAGPPQGKALFRVLAQARRTGVLRLAGRGMTELPDEVYALHEESNRQQNERWWEAVDVTLIDLSRNQLSFLDDRGIAQWSPACLTVLLNHNALRALPLGLTEFPVLSKLDASHNRLGGDVGSTTTTTATATTTTTTTGSVTSEGKEQTDARVDWYDGNNVEAVISQVPSLTDVNLSGNALSSFFQEGKWADARSMPLRGVQQLRLDDNRLSVLPLCVGLAPLSTLSVKNNLLTRLPVKLTGWTGLTELDLEGNQLQHIPSLQSLTALATLNVSRNQLTTLPALPSTALARIHARYNRLKSLDGIDAAKSLVLLEVGDNQLSTLPGRQLVALRHLKILDCSNNDIGTIPGELGLLPELNKLVCDGNPLRRMPRSKLLLPVDKLKRYLLTRLPEQELKELRAAFEEPPQTMPSSQSAGKSGVKRAGAGAGGSDGASLVKDPASALPLPVKEAFVSAVREAHQTGALLLRGGGMELSTPLTSFPMLYLTDSHDSQRHRLRAMCQGVRTLDLSRHALTCLPVQVGVEWRRSLRILRLERNQFRFIPFCVSLMEGLEELVLRFNQLDSLECRDEQHTARLPTSLRTLDLRNNRFARIPSLLDPGQKHGPSKPRSTPYALHSLLLGYNRLSCVDPVLWSEYGQLQELDLSNNRVRELPKVINQHLPHLQSLDLQNNDIKHIPWTLACLPRLKHLLLSGNPQRTVSYSLVTKGSSHVIAYLRSKIPHDFNPPQPNQGGSVEQGAGGVGVQSAGGREDVRYASAMVNDSSGFGQGSGYGESKRGGSSLSHPEFSTGQQAGSGTLAPSRAPAPRNGSSSYHPAQAIHGSGGGVYSTGPPYGTDGQESSHMTRSAQSAGGVGGDRQAPSRYAHQQQQQHSQQHQQQPHHLHQQQQRLQQGNQSLQGRHSSYPQQAHAQSAGMQRSVHISPHRVRVSTHPVPSVGPSEPRANNGGLSHNDGGLSHNDGGLSGTEARALMEKLRVQVVNLELQLESSSLSRRRQRSLKTAVQRSRAELARLQASVGGTGGTGGAGGTGGSGSDVIRSPPQTHQHVHQRRSGHSHSHGHGHSGSDVYAPQHGPRRTLAPALAPSQAPSDVHPIYSSPPQTQTHQAYGSPSRGHIQPTVGSPSGPRPGAEVIPAGMRTPPPDRPVSRGLGRTPEMARRNRTTRPW